VLAGGCVVIFGTAPVSLNKKRWKMSQGFVKLIEELRPLIDAQLQTLRCGEAHLALHFFGPRIDVWLVGCFGHAEASVSLMASPTFKKKPKPVGLFAQAHMLHQRLRNIQVDGDTLALVFDDSRLVFWMQEDGLNARAQTATSRVTWKKPQPVRPWDAPVRRSVRSPRAMPPPSSSEAVDPRRLRLEKSLARVDEEIAQKSDDRYRRLGDFARQQPDAALPPELTGLAPEELRGHALADWAFSKAKVLEKKLKGTRARREILLAEARAVAAGAAAVPVPRAPSLAISPRLGVQTRKLALEDGRVAYVGKSADDNLRLLRAAPPWALWIHLRDEPSSHCLVHRRKGESIPDAELFRIFQWFLGFTLKARAKSARGQIFDVIVTEARHVRPIKGAKGRVTYSQERVYRYRFIGDAGNADR
jgi:hypothetical protein